MAATGLKRILFIENSTGLGGSTISLCTLLSMLNLDLYEPFIVLSRAAQREFLDTQLSFASSGHTKVIKCRPPLKGSKVIRILARFAGLSANALNGLFSGLLLHLTLPSYFYLMLCSYFCLRGAHASI